MDIDELEQLYAGVKTFEPNYLDQLSQILDNSNVWGSLAELLGFEHLISSGIIHDKSMSKAVLKYATEVRFYITLFLLPQIIIFFFSTNK